MLPAMRQVVTGSIMAKAGLPAASVASRSLQTTAGTPPVAVPRHPRSAASTSGERGQVFSSMSLCDVATHGNRSMSTASTKETTREGWAVMEAHGKLQRWKHVVGELGELEVDIKVECNGLCMSDISMRDNHWGMSKFAFIPGHEVAGVVSGVGKGVKGLKVGQRAGVGWIRDSCRTCASCLRGNENVCVTGYTGTIVMGQLGGFQDTLRAPADFVYAIPDAIDSVSAAPLLCAGVTVFAPLRRHIKGPGANVAIIGVGGLGHLALQFANAMGANVTAVDVDATKSEEAKGLGAHTFANFDEAVSTGPKSKKNEFDVVLNCASGKIDTSLLLDMLKPDGTLIQIGLPGGVTMQVPLLPLVFGQKKLAGSIVGGRADMMEMLKTAALKGVRPMVETFPLNKVNDAIEYMLTGKARYRVVMLSDGYVLPKDTTGLQRIVKQH